MKVKNKVPAIVLICMLAIGLMPLTAFAAEPLTETLVINSDMETVDKTAGEGWKWESNGNGGTLTLNDFNLKLTESSQGNNNYGIQFKGFKDADIDIVLIGENRIVSQKGGMGHGILASGCSVTIKSEMKGSLFFDFANKNISAYVDPSAIFSKNLYIESGKIDSNISLCLTDREVAISGGEINVHARDIISSSGIYSVWGPVTISGGEVFLNGAINGIFIANTDPKAGDPLSVNITGGNVTIVADNPQEGAWGYGISTPNLLIDTDGCLKIYGKDIAIYSVASGNGEERDIKILNLGKDSVISNSEESPYPAVLVADQGNGTSIPNITINPADYTKVDEAIAKADSLSPDDYTNFSTVEDAINAVVRGKDITEQGKVNDMALAIENAIANLERKPVPGITEEPSESPTDTSAPSGDQPSETTSPETGDESNMVFWIGVMLASGSALTGTVLYNRKRKYSR